MKDSLIKKASVVASSVLIAAAPLQQVDAASVNQAKTVIAQPKIVVEVDENVTLQLGDDSESVLKLKEDLEKAGFPIQAEKTTVFDEETKQAVTAFQKYFELAEDGIVTGQTTKKLAETVESPFQLEKQDDEIIQLKANLAQLGFEVVEDPNSEEPIPVDLYSEETEKQVIAFQKEFDLIENGIADEITLAEMEELLDELAKIKAELEADLEAEAEKEQAEIEATDENDSVVDEEAVEGETDDSDDDVEVDEEIDEDITEEAPTEDETIEQEQEQEQEQVEVDAEKKSEEKVKENDKQLSTPMFAPMSIAVAKDYLIKGDNNADVKKLKQDLAKLGFEASSNPTNLFGAKTEKAVQDFQKYYGLTADGIAGQATFNKINSILSSPLQRGKSHTNTIKLKQDLEKLGFKVSNNPTKLYGVTTEKKVKEFQKKYGLKQHGIADEVTLKKIADLLKSESTSSYLSKGDNNEKVKKLKQDLAKLGFEASSNPTNLFGAKTEKAVQDFQKYYGLTADGIAGQATFNKINSILSSPLQRGKSHTNTIKLKQDLEKLGFKVSNNPTKLYGVTTEKKVKEFQKKYGLKQHGIADEVTLKKIADLLKNNGSSGGSGTTKTTYTNYKLSLSQAVNMQMERPIVATDMHRNKSAYVSASSSLVRVSGNQLIGRQFVNVRQGAGTNHNAIGRLHKDEQLTILEKGSGWHRVSSSWLRPTITDLTSYMNPNNNDKFQHLRLDSSVNLPASELNKVLAGKGTLSGQGKAFIDGGKKHGVNEAYLIAHAILETGNGNSALAKGVKYNGKTVYNMYGIGAVDGNATNAGAKTAYENGWTTPAKAIEGGAKWIASQYIQNAHKQNTLYKMRWNPRMSEGYAWKQYATDIGWATKQTSRIKDIYSQLNKPSYHYDIPKYN